MTDRIKFTMIGLVIMLCGTLVIDLTSLNVTGFMLIIFSVLLIIGAHMPNTKP